MSDPVQSVRVAGDIITATRLERARMPRRLKQIADALIAEPEDFLVLTNKDIASKLDVSPSALVRFAQSFGFSGFSELQTALRRDLLGRRSSYLDRAAAAAPGRDPRHRDMGHVLDAVTNANAEAISGLSRSVDPEAVAASAADLRSARLTGIAAQRRALPVAQYLFYGLSRCELPTLMVDGTGGLAAEQSQVLGPRDALVAISFAPYSETTLAVVEASRARGARVLAITDDPGSALAEAADRALVVQEADHSDIRSIAASITLVQAILVAIGLKIPAR